MIAGRVPHFLARPDTDERQSRALCRELVGQARTPSTRHEQKQESRVTMALDMATLQSMSKIGQMLLDFSPDLLDVHSCGSSPSVYQTGTLAES